jgi:ribosome-binding protein aMBF1 (putative translation factor)
MSEEKYKPPYTFSTHIGAACNRQSRTFVDLAEKLKTDVQDLVRQCNGQAPPSKALVKGMAKELDINESFLSRLADEVRKDLGAK